MARLTGIASDDTRPLDSRITRQQQITEMLVKDKTLTAEKRAELTSELRKNIVAQTTADERQAWEDAPIEEKRDYFSLSALKVPGVDQETLAEYTWAESDLITTARNLDLSSATVRGLRDAGVRLAQQAAEYGRPVSEDALDSAIGPFKLNQEQRQAIKRLYRSLEG